MTLFDRFYEGADIDTDPNTVLARIAPKGALWVHGDGRALALDSVTVTRIEAATAKDWISAGKVQKDKTPLDVSVDIYLVTSKATS